MQRRTSSVPRATLPYGATELKEYEPRALLLSFGMSVLLVPGVLTLLTWMLALPDDPSPVQPGSAGAMIIRMDLPPPMAWDVPTGPRHPGKSLSTFAIPIPVPFQNVDTTVAFPSFEDLGTVPGDVGDPGDGGKVIPIQVPDEVEPRPFEPRQVEPSIALRVDPRYPAVAIRAGLEGNVFMRIWVDTRGLVRKAEVVRSDCEIFEQPALSAVSRWVFTPALMQDRPVGVWVTVPIRFRLRSHE